MTFGSLLIQRVVVMHVGDLGTADRYGNPERGVTSSEHDVPCRIEQLSAEELTIERDTASATHRGFFLPTQTLGPYDVIDDLEQTYAVVGPPTPARDATGVHHTEALLRTVSDVDWGAS